MQPAFARLNVPDVLMINPQNLVGVILVYFLFIVVYSGSTAADLVQQSTQLWVSRQHTKKNDETSR